MSPVSDVEQTPTSTVLPGIDYMIDADPPATPHIRLNGHIRFVGPGSMECTLDEEEFAAILPGDVDD